MASWNSLRSELKNSCMQCQMQLTFWLNTLLPSISQKSKIREPQSFTMGWKESDFLSANVHELQTKRHIENSERFLNSKANMELNAIESEDKHHAKMEGAYSLVMRNPRIPDNCKKDLEEARNFHWNKRQKRLK